MYVKEIVLPERLGNIKLVLLLMVPGCEKVYMEFPCGFKVPGGIDRKAVVLKLHCNLYGQKQARRVWYEYLHKRLITNAGFVQSKHDESLFYQGKVMYALYIDD